MVAMAAAADMGPVAMVASGPGHCTTVQWQW